MNDEKKDFAEEAKDTSGEFTRAANDPIAPPANKKILAGVLAILLGGFGVHKFILGYTKEGIIMLAVTVVLVIFIPSVGWPMWVLGLIEGIIYLTKSDEEFYRTYQLGKKPWF